ncbi:hypothetical protein Tco_0160170 [Tanacetum coccineum]
MQPWSSSLVFKSRLAWLIIEGVPLKCGPQSPSQELGGCGVRFWDADDILNSNSDMVKDDQFLKDDGGDTAEDHGDSKILGSDVFVPFTKVKSSYSDVDLSLTPMRKSG